MLFQTPEGQYLEIHRTKMNDELYTIFSKNLQENEAHQLYVPYDEFCSHVNIAYQMDLVNPQSNLKMLDDIREQLNQCDKPTSPISAPIVLVSTVPTIVRVRASVSTPSLVQQQPPILNSHYHNLYRPPYLMPEAGPRILFSGRGQVAPQVRVMRQGTHSLEPTT